MSRLGYVLALGCLCHVMRLLFPCELCTLLESKDGDIYYGVHECIDCALYNHSNHSRKHATNIVPECKRTS